MRGYDVIARPSYGAEDTLKQAQNWLSAFKYSSERIVKCEGKTGAEFIKSVENNVREFGKGARAIISFDWKEETFGKGHVLMARCREGGIINIADPQTGEIAAVNKLNYAKVNSVWLIRVDDLDFTEIIKRCCMNRGDKI